MSECKVELMLAGKAYPRTCPTCGIFSTCAKGLKLPTEDPDFTERCTHGHLKRSCDLCDYIWELSQANARIAELESENRLLTETGQLNVLADIREIVDPMSPGRMMQSELVERIREIVAENARLAAIVEKLPKTADGVEFYPGMTVFDADARKVETGSAWFNAIEVYGNGVGEDVEVDVIRVEGHYSTEAAALAAKERQR